MGGADAAAGGATRPPDEGGGGGAGKPRTAGGGGEWFGVEEVHVEEGTGDPDVWAWPIHSDQKHARLAFKKK